MKKTSRKVLLQFALATFITMVLVSVSSCRKDFSTIPNFGNLQFSKDTVFLDTIFKNIGSSTYTFKVYNNSNKDITIPNIALENGYNSNYRLNVDGDLGIDNLGKIFEDIDILAKDSIFIFVETTKDTNEANELLHAENVVFDTGNRQQSVNLVTLVKDANFIFPNRNEIDNKFVIDTLFVNDESTGLLGRFLKDDELTFTNEKPTVIYGFAAVPKGKTLTIEAGAKVHFHENSGLIIDTGATLKVQGTLDRKIIFEGDRLEPNFNNVAGQWGTIWLREGSVNNSIEHAVIKNAVVGILVDGITSSRNSTLHIRNSEIYNHSSFGILGRNTNIRGANTVIGNAGQCSLAATLGGFYNFNHCTFSNYWNNSLRQLPTVLVNNFIRFKDKNGEEITETLDLTSATFVNCIIDGGNNIEFVLDRVEGSSFNYNINSCMIQFNDTNKDFEGIPEVDFTNEFFNNIILNGNADFKDVRANDFRIGENSDAINKGIRSIYNTDILGIDRTTAPDLGTYQHIIFKEDED